MERKDRGGGGKGMNKTRPIIAITNTGSEVFSSLADAAGEYEIRPSSLVKLIQAGQVHKDMRTTFDYYIGPMEG